MRVPVRRGLKMRVHVTMTAWYGLQRGEAQVRPIAWFVQALLVIGSLGATSGEAVEPWQQAVLTAPAYAYETQDFGIPPTSTIRTSKLDAPTPTQIPGASPITTPQLRDLLVSQKAAVLIDVLGGNQTVSLPGAVWLSGAGLGTSFDDPVQQRLAVRLAELTGGDKTKPVVFFCLSQTCWLSYNAALRAVALSYSNVRWYRGGRRAWEAAGLAMAPVGPSSF